MSADTVIVHADVVDTFIEKLMGAANLRHLKAADPGSLLSQRNGFLSPIDFKQQQKLKWQGVQETCRYSYPERRFSEIQIVATDKA